MLSNAFRAIGQYAQQLSHKPHFLTLERSAICLHNSTAHFHDNSNTTSRNAQVANNVHQFITHNNDGNNKDNNNQFMFLGNTLGLINNSGSSSSSNNVLMNCGAYIIVHMFASTLANAVQHVTNSGKKNNNNFCLASQMSLPLL